ncbi:collagenase [Peribacillus loiseleuriae]|uniref:collagenase n=1 Tax=Peribacillus loiseleuriae TaxID=1679170 RepID=UPI003D043DF0
MKFIKNKAVKIIFIIFSGILILFILLVLLVLKEFQKEISQAVGKEMKLFDTIKAVTTLNYDSQEEKEFKRKSQKEQINDISVYYAPKLQGIVPLTKETLQRADHVTKKYLGNYKNKSVDLLFIDPKDLKTFSTLKDISGFYSDFDKVIAIGLNVGEVENIIQKKETPLYLFQKSILHEYTHYATYRKLDEMGTNTTMNDFPVWFIEGIAEYIGNDENHLDYHSFEPTFINFERLNTHEQWENARLLEDVNPYLQGYFTVAYLINTYGQNIISTLLEETYISKDFYQTLHDVTGINIEEFENEVSNYYQ